MDQLRKAKLATVSIIVITSLVAAGHIWSSTQAGNSNRDHICQLWSDGINRMVSNFLIRSNGDPAYSSEYPKIMQEIKQFGEEC
jgi:hypothetical protein